MRFIGGTARAGVNWMYIITIFTIWNGSTIYGGRGNIRDGFLTKRQESHPIRRRLSPGSKSRRDRGGDYSTRLFEPKFTTSICLSITCPGEAIDCKMRPVMLLTFDDEIVLKAYCIRPVVTRLSQYTDQRVPDGTTMPRFAAADVDRILAGRSGSLYPIRTGKP